MKISQCSENLDQQAMIMVFVTPKEAVHLIASLSAQMVAGSGNVGRMETTDAIMGDKKVYFSIAVEIG